MIKLILTLVISLITFFSLAQSVSAHVLLTSGSIGTTLHISPDDDPAVGTPANFYFEFKDKENKFNPSDCICKIQILKNDTELHTEDLFTTSLTNDINAPAFQFTFPEKNVYTIKIKGTPKTPESFQDFEINHTLRITREQSSNQPTTANSSGIHFFHYLTAAIAVVVFAIILFLDRRGRNKKTPKKPQKIIALILGFSLLTPLIYASVHFSSDHLMIGSHENHPCCLVTSPETANPTFLILNQHVQKLFYSDYPKKITLESNQLLASRPPPTN